METNGKSKRKSFYRLKYSDEIYTPIYLFTYFSSNFYSTHYGATRIFLPEWIISQISSSLPKGVKPEIGEMYTTNKLGVLYKDITYKNNSLDLQIELIEPKANISEPINILISKGNLKTTNSRFFLNDLNGKVRLKNFSNREISFLGNIKKLRKSRNYFRKY